MEIDKLIQTIHKQIKLRKIKPYRMKLNETNKGDGQTNTNKAEVLFKLLM